MATTKYLDYAGLEYLVQQLYARGFNGMGLSQENFTKELKAKYDALAAASSIEDLTALFTRVSAIESLLSEETNSSAAIDKFNEIVAFLKGIEDTKTLDGLLGDIIKRFGDYFTKTEAEAKFQAAGDYATTEALTAAVTPKANIADVYTKTAADQTFVAKEAGKALSSNDYTAADKAEVAKVKDKLDSADVVAITNAEIDSIIAPE